MNNAINWHDDTEFIDIEIHQPNCGTAQVSYLKHQDKIKTKSDELGSGIKPTQILVRHQLPSGRYHDN
jgi:hypothetical protein